ncbi:MAG TPA: GAF domain-containing sensor histidine kinase [Actinopolymorphaceae bacterium]|nr:GAF domain-containing sensor histidine kinase [Actinopolymorphaceae bacterium]
MGRATGSRVAGDVRPHDVPRWGDHLRAVADVNDAVRDGLDHEAVLGLIARRVRRAVGASACAVMTLESDDQLLVRAVDGEAVRDLAGAWVPVDGTPEGECVRSQQALTTHGSTETWTWSSSSPAGLRQGSVLVAPVPGYERPGGVISVSDGGERRFTPEDVQVVGLFAASVGMEVEHDRARADLERLAVTTVADARPLQQTLDTLTASVVAATGAAACAVHLLDDDLSLAQVACHDPDHLVGAGMAAAGSSVAQAAIASRSPIVHENVVTGSVDGHRGTYAAGQAVAATCLVCVPLLSRGAVLGVLWCHRPAGSRPSKLELAYLSVVAGRAAAAIDSAKLVGAAQEKAALEERQRLARELHDSVSQALYGIALGARTARQALDDGRDLGVSGLDEHVQIDQPIAYILQLAEAGLADMRALIFELRPQALAEEGLVAALGKQLAALQARHGVRTYADLGREPGAGLKVKQALYRIAQEALQNIARHAQASRVTMRLSGSSTVLALEISDDGTGFDATASFPGHLGLRSMRERIAEIGGVLDLTSAPGKGTQIKVRAPSTAQS